MNQSSFSTENILTCSDVYAKYLFILHFFPQLSLFWRTEGAGEGTKKYRNTKIWGLLLPNQWFFLSGASRLQEDLAKCCSAGSPEKMWIIDPVGCECSKSLNPCHKEQKCLFWGKFMVYWAKAASGFVSTITTSSNSFKSIGELPLVLKGEERVLKSSK